jgi:hypothetical protein
MKVAIYSGDALVWEREGARGFTSRAYSNDGTINRLIVALEDALTQARGESAVAFDVAKIIPDISLAAT